MPTLTRSSTIVRGLILRSAAMGLISTSTHWTTTEMIRIIRKYLLAKNYEKGFISVGKSFLALISLKIYSITYELNKKP